MSGIRCPRCNLQTRPFNLEADLFFDRCLTCEGMWLDHGELGRTVGVNYDLPEPEVLSSGLVSQRNCPKCTVSLTEVFFTEKSKVMVDVCQSCQGLWLDSRELSKVQGILRDHRIEEKKKKILGLKKE